MEIINGHFQFMCFLSNCLQAELHSSLCGCCFFASSLFFFSIFVWICHDCNQTFVRSTRTRSYTLTHSVNESEKTHRDILYPFCAGTIFNADLKTEKKKELKKKTQQQQQQQQQKYGNENEWIRNGNTKMRKAKNENWPNHLWSDTTKRLIAVLYCV